MNQITSFPSTAKFGTISANGNVPMRSDPDFTGGKDTAEAVPVAMFPVKTAQVEITGTATLTMQGSNGDDVWEDLGSLTADGVINNDDMWKLVRFVVSGYGSGDVNVRFFAGG